MEELKHVPHQLRQHWTHAEGDGVTIGDEARQMVRFRSLNLQGDWPMKTHFDVIFCRNVMIYFDNPTKERLVARFTQYLQPGGYLYIGHSERATGPGAANLEPCGPTIYRRI
jgi:chemotaxis protein methyltransferase CheR